MKFVRLADGTIINADLVLYAGQMYIYGSNEKFYGSYQVHFKIENTGVAITIGPHKMEDGAKLAIQQDLDEIWNAIGD